MGLTFQHLEMQGGLDFRPWITGIASVQKTCGIDPKVLGTDALSGAAGASEKPGCWSVYATGGMGEAQSTKNLLYPQTSYYVRLEWLIYEGFFGLLGGVGDMRLDGMRRWEGDTWSI
jgi:hypothetical protein